MNTIKSDAQVKLSTSYATYNGMTVIKISIPLNPNKLLEGKNLIECIADSALPDWATILT
jgi:hypothetical protein